MNEFVKKLIKQLELFETTKIVNYDDDDFIILKKDDTNIINGYRNPFRTRVKAS